MAKADTITGGHGSQAVGFAFSTSTSPVGSQVCKLASHHRGYVCCLNLAAAEMGLVDRPGIESALRAWWLHPRFRIECRGDLDVIRIPSKRQHAAI
jgi:hypothetical protein